MSLPRNLDLNLIKVFHAVYATRSVSGAARQMGISQPSISRSLGRLREHFDDALFERSGNGVAPTTKADAIVPSIVSALELIEGVIDEPQGFDPANDKRHFRMIIPDAIELEVTPQIVNALPQGSQLTFETFSMIDLDFETAVTNGDVDLGILPFIPSQDGLVYRKLTSDNFVIIARTGHPEMVDGFSWSLLNRVKFVALPERVFRLGRLDELLRTQGLARQIAYVSHKLSSIPMLVSSTDLIAFMGERYARILQDNWNINVFDAPGLSAIKQDIYLVHAKRNDNDPGIAWLCQQIEQTYR